MRKSLPLELFFTFARIGLFTFGGGYAMIPLIQRETSERRLWISREELLDVVAIAESTPGPIAVNAATFIGRKVAGTWGAVCATLGVVLPSFAVMALISLALEQFQHLRPIRYAFWGVQAGVLALILRAWVSMFRACPRDWFSFGIMALSFLAVAVLRVSPIWVILVCAVCGLIRQTSGGKAS